MCCPVDGVSYRMRRIIGEEKALSIKVGAEAGDQSTEDIIVVRGASAEVDRAVKEILKIVEDAKDDLILSSYVCSFYHLPHPETHTMWRLKSVGFEIDREYVGRIVGSQGSGVNKLREVLGIRIDFSDDGDDVRDANRKRKGSGLKSKVTVRKTHKLPRLMTNILARLLAAKRTLRRPSAAFCPKWSAWYAHFFT